MPIILHLKTASQMRLHACFRKPQIIDTGLDETSCFFTDGDGLEVEHGYYFEELGFVGTPSSAGNHYAPFEGGHFPFDLTRRKVRHQCHSSARF